MMKAIIYYGAGKVQLEEIPKPQLRSNRVLVKILACGVCGGEYKMVKKQEGTQPETAGVIPGHEVVGEIVESQIAQLPRGMLVAVAPNTNCGLCDNCRRGISHLCYHRPVQVGGYAEYCLVQPGQCHPVPSHVTPVEAAMTEPLACCVYALDRVNLKQGERVIVIGAGANALLFVQLARLKGASFVMIVDNMRDRMELALQLGADIAIDSAKVDPLQAAAAIRTGADVVIVNRGNPESLNDAVRWCDTGGRVLCYGVGPAGCAAHIEPHRLWQKEISIVGSRSYYNTFGAALALIASGQVQVKPIINRVVSLDGITDALQNAKGAIKTVITMQS
jgi:threonine dehydrogenase-like Zn-dependent dehydrogenase